MDEAAAPGPKIQAYVEANLQLVARGDHALARALASAASGHSPRPVGSCTTAWKPRCGRRSTDHGSSDPARMAELVQSIVYALSRMIEGGLPAGTATGPRPRDFSAVSLDLDSG